MTRAALTAQASDDPNYVPPFPYAARFPVPQSACASSRSTTPGCLVSDYKLEDRRDPDGCSRAADACRSPRRTEIGDWDDLCDPGARRADRLRDRRPITGDRGRKSDCWAEFQRLTKDAAGVDAKEDPPEQLTTAAG
jgi:hypothetical protein